MHARSVGVKSDSSETEMRSKCLQTGEKVIFAITAKIIAELYSSVLWKVELVNEKIGYLTEEIPMYSVEREAYFLPSQ